MSQRHWRSVSQGEQHAIQTQDAALVKTLPKSQPLTESSWAIQVPTLTITTVHGRRVQSDFEGAKVEFFKGQKIDSFSVKFAHNNSVGHGELYTADGDDTEIEFLELISRPTQCTSMGPFRLTGPGWNADLTFKLAFRGGDCAIEVHRSKGRNRNSNRRLHVGQNLQLWLESEEDDVVTVMTIAKSAPPA